MLSSDIDIRIGMTLGEVNYNLLSGNLIALRTNILTVGLMREKPEASPIDS